jgi:Uma2 family endonuclease
MAEPARKPSMTTLEFLDWVEQHGVEGVCYDLIHGEIVAQAASRAAHGRVKAASWLALSAAIRKAGVRCEAFVETLTVEIADGLTFEPDVLVECGPPLAPDARLSKNPVIVIEVLSPSTERRDETTKYVGYLKQRGVPHYLVIDPDNRLVIHHRRVSDGEFATRILTTGTLTLDPPGLTVAVADLFGALPPTD